MPLGHPAGSASASSPGLCWRRVCPREVHSFEILSESSTRLAAEAGFRRMALLFLFYFWQPPNQALFNLLPPCQGAYGGGFSPGRK